MEYIYLKARAKINVALDILGKRDDGYHEIKTIMQSLKLYDGIFLKKMEKGSLKLVCNLKWMPTDKKNLVYAAAKFLIEEYDIEQGVFIELTKNIPVSAGLGGGSSDCAATLIGMRRLFDLPITNSELYKIGKEFGADVPFCLMRGTVLAEGIGEKLTKLTPHPEVIVLLARPAISVSTASIFKSLELSEIAAHPNIDRLITELTSGNLEGISANMGNVLEEVTGPKHIEIYKLRDIMIKSNALNAMMSGSGPTVFGYFLSMSDANKAVGKIRQELPLVRDIYVTSVYNPILTKKRMVKRNGKK